MLVKCNNIPRPILYGFELSEKERADFDYCEDIESEQFIKYKGQLYHLGDIMRINYGRECLPEEFKKFDGYVSDSFFSGVLFRFADDCESVICATYIS